MKTTAKALMDRRRELRAKFGMVARPVVRADLVRPPKPAPVAKENFLSPDSAVSLSLALGIKRANDDFRIPGKAPRVLLAREVAEKHGVAYEDLFLPHRNKRIVAARREYYYRAVTDLGHSYAQIGRFFGQDHTTVMHGVNAYVAEHKLPHPTKD